MRPWMISSQTCVPHTGISSLEGVVERCCSRSICGDGAVREGEEVAGEVEVTAADPPPRLHCHLVISFVDSTPSLSHRQIFGSVVWIHLVQSRLR